MEFKRLGRLLLSLYMLTVPREFGGQPLVHVLSGRRVVAGLLGVWIVVGAWGVVSPELSWPIMAPVLVAVAMTSALAAKAGMVRLLVRRRGVKSPAYSNLVSPKGALATAEALLWKTPRISSCIPL